MVDETKEDLGLKEKDLLNVAFNFYGGDGRMMWGSGNVNVIGIYNSAEFLKEYCK